MNETSRSYDVDAELLTKIKKDENNFELRGNNFEYELNRLEDTYMNVDDGLVYDHVDRPFGHINQGVHVDPNSLYSTINSKNKMKKINEDELKMTYDISDDSDSDLQQNDSARFEIPPYKPLSNLVLDLNRKENIYENSEEIENSHQNSSFASNNMPSDSSLKPIDDSQPPAYRLPSKNLNLPMYNPSYVQADNANLQVKFNPKGAHNNLVTALLRSRLENQENASSKQEGSELSVESRRKIDEVKAKLDALSKKYAVDEGILRRLKRRFLFII